MTLPNDRPNDMPSERDREQDREQQQRATEQDPAGQAAANGGSDELDVGALQSALAAAEASAAEHKDLYMRALAELENVRKRAARDVEQARKFALERFAGELIGVKDSLELGLASAVKVAGAEARALVEGTEATLKLLVKAFENAGIVEIDPEGQPFDPQLHEAMVMQPSANQAPNTVLQVVQKGYELNGRLLRPARVVVAKEPH